MKNFSRILRLALHYRLTLLTSIACALGVAILWGGNISAIYPFVKVAFQGESLQGWIEKEIQTSQRTVREKTAQIKQSESLLEQSPPQRQRGLRAEIDLARSRVAAEQSAQRRFRWLQPYIDRFLPHNPFKTLILITGLLLVGTVVKDLFLIGNNVLVARLAQLSTFRLRKLFYRRTLKLNLASFAGEGTADLMSRFTHDMEHVTVGVETLFGKLVREPLKMAACLIGAGLVCWRLLVLSLLIAPLAALLIQWLAKTLKRANRRAMEEMAEIYSALEETFRGIKIVKAFTGERQERRRFHARSKQYYRKSMRIAQYNSLSRPITEVMGILTICMALLAGAWLVLSHQTHLLGIRMSPRPLSPESLLLFYGLLVGAADPIRKFSDVFMQLQRAAAASDRIFARLDRQPAVRDPKHPVPIKRHRQDLVFDGVHFAYQPGQPVLQDVNLRIGFGQTIAVVGPNGSGKSTLANLIPRFYDPTQGTICIDGVSLKDVRLRELRGQIGMVTQETLLFDDTIFNNIRYGSPQATSHDVIQAARQAHAHEFIESELPDGYQTVAGPLGGRLSGGQRQRIALARAILRNPAILILDEATSQVDPESERVIQQVLEEFISHRTAVVITHRMAILALADQIVVMQSGRILDTGRHDELLARCELYRRLYQIEFKDPGKGAGPPLAA
jgi:ATP-binding cassette subfamily B protein/subfamily B ATP-binding cassette protein MsbA